MSKNFTSIPPPQIPILNLKTPNTQIRSTFKCVNKNITHTKIPFTITITPNLYNYSDDLNLHVNDSNLHDNDLNTEDKILTTKDKFSNTEDTHDNIISNTHNNIISNTKDAFSNTKDFILNTEVIRCDHCKSYINKYVEIIDPGLQWKCNLCFHINKTDTQFEKTNTGKYKMYELNNEIYEISAPSSYVLKSPNPPSFVFMIEMTKQSMKIGMPLCIVESIKNNLCDLIVNNTNMRYAVVFYNDYACILNNNGALTLLTDDVPNLFEDDYLFDSSDFPTFDFNILTDVLSDDLSDSLSEGCNLFNAFNASKRILKNGGTICTFLSSKPEKNKFLELSDIFVYQGLCVNLFLFSNTNIDLKDFYIMSQKTSGLVFYYPNFTNDDYFTFKFNHDFSNFVNLKTSRDVICKVRSNKGIKMTNYYGNLSLKNNDILGFTHFYPNHSFTFECEISSIDTKEIYFQVAMLKTVNNQRIIRVINFFIPVYDNIYGNLDVNAIIYTFALKLVKDPKFPIMDKVKAIINAYKSNTNQNDGLRLPPCLHALPLLTLALLKCIPFRQSNYTPMDYKVYYQYLIVNQCTKLTDTLIYPTLLPLHQLLIEDLDYNNNKIYDYCVNLSLYSLDVDGIYMLDTGVNIFVFVCCQCENQIIFTNIKNGRFVPNFKNTYENKTCETKTFENFKNSGNPECHNDIQKNSENFECKNDVQKNSEIFKLNDEYGLRMDKIIHSLRKDRFLMPNFVLIRDDGNTNVFRDIFMSYFVEDKGCGLESYENFIKKLI